MPDPSLSEVSQRGSPEVDVPIHAVIHVSELTRRFGARTALA
jgi:hypothetical protein